MSQLKVFITQNLIDNCIISGSPGVGTTSVVQAIANELCLDHNVLYYNPSNSINRKFVQPYYNNMFNNVTVITGEIDIFLEYLINCVMDNVNYKYIIIDPGDMLLAEKKVLESIRSILDPMGAKLICTSQIRTDPGNQKTYSTLERWNLRYKNLSDMLFKRSIWLRNVTAPDDIYKLKYLDTFIGGRKNNKYDERHIIKFSKNEGYIL